jgi:hypothetical protein
MENADDASLSPQLPRFTLLDGKDTRLAADRLRRPAFDLEYWWAEPPSSRSSGRPREEPRLRSPLFSTGMIEVGVQSRNVAYHSWTLSILCCTSTCRGRCGQWQITTIFLLEVEPMRMSVS